MQLLLDWAASITIMCANVQAVQTNVSSLCSPSEAVPSVVKGDTTYVCVNVNNKYRALFTPLVDMFTVLRLVTVIVPSWNDTRIGANPSGAFLTVSSLNYRTNYKLYSSRLTGRISSYMTAIIFVKKGIVQGVSWDDGCYFCSAEMCDYNLYSKPEETPAAQLGGQGKACFNLVEGYYITNSSDAGVNVGGINSAGTNDSSLNTTAQCDITIYVGWTGTDKNGDYLGSSSLRTSQFFKYSTGSFFSHIGASLSRLAPTSRGSDANMFIKMHISTIGSCCLGLS
ncbi:hypothetical protein PsorP6_012400 [Peronosclerospora sorghi]|uniref:Uncharacterized protein n=1 Tax=Peronosclerospora sorghi TaxID=230839 RepID=A0ACC0WJ93_9STRA|nr:hypothetical protein PsorP6_012400 [Peronosclerospora sorghi]